jgi:hypothetical protein
MREGPSTPCVPAWHAHPAFAPFRRWLVRCEPDAPPSLATLNDWAGECGLALPDRRPLRFVSRPAAGAIDYERTVMREAIVATREHDWHDALNALCWLAFPRTKAALNAVHACSPEAPTPNARTRERDFATLIDESGLLFACDDAALVQLLRAHAWRELFVERAADVAAHVRAACIGHGLLDKLRRPYRAITAKSLVIDVAAVALWDAGAIDAFDASACRTLCSIRHEPESLAPLPVAALPGWDCESLGARLVDDASVFRSKLPR